MEVLAGPQGTLYGRNATGGAVNVITNQPGKEFGVYAEAEAGNYGESRFESAINLPFDYDFDFATLTAISGYRFVKAYDIFLQPPSPLIGGSIGTQDFPAKSNTYSTEIRLSSTATTPLQWVGGLYGFKENTVGPICV
jgi:hypothetical protein